jgi:hypothetical protein
VLRYFFVLLMALALPPLVFFAFLEVIRDDVNIMAGARTSEIE